jgi:eukaryotic-like serine/threonine-protein kinase
MSLSPCSPAAADRNLLFGVLALQMDFISREALIQAMNAWVLDKRKPLGQILVEQGALTPRARALLDPLVQMHLELHSNDPQKSLAAIPPPGGLQRDLESVADPDVQASLVFLPPTVGPHVTRSLSAPSEDAAGEGTAAGPGSAAQRYRILRPHARGGLGEVFVAQDEELHREVALKEIQQQHSDQPASRARFLLEAEITGGLEHPGIVPVYGLGLHADGRPFYAMRFIKGDSLKDAIDRFHQADAALRDPGERSLALRQLLRRFIDVCNAIAYAHSRGVIHRDLKPQNIMLGPYGETLVVDWGLAKSLGRRDAAAGPVEATWLPTRSTDSGLTQMGSVFGTPGYMSPEQAAGNLQELGPATDIYSLGATLYCLLTGKPPIHDDDVVLALARVQRGEFPPPRQVKPLVSAALEAICLKALAKQPAERYPSARELARDVEHWLADEPVAAHRERWWQRAARWARHHQAAMAAGTAAVLVALLLGGAGAFAWQREQARREAEQARQADQERQKVQAKLQEVLRLRSQGRWDSGRTLLRHVEEQLGEEGPSDLRDQVAQARRQLELLARLDDIRLQAASIVEGKLDTVGADREYAAVFAESGLGKEGESAEEVAQRIRDSGIAGELVAALDAWSAFAVQGSRVQWVLAIARHVDPDPVWRDRARDPAVRSDRAALERLAGEARAPDQSPPLVLSVSVSLVRAGGDARGMLRQAWQRHPDDFWLAFQLANVLHWQQEHAEAAGFCRAALALRPGSSMVHSNLGIVLDYQRKREEAIEEYRRAIQLDPQYASPHYSLGKDLWEQGKPEEAMQELRRAEQLDPKAANIHHGLGTVLHAQGKWEEAIREFRHALQLDPNYANPHNGLGNVWRAQGKREEASEEYRLAIQLDPKDAGPHINLGNVLHEQGKREEASEEYRRAIQLDPKNATPHVCLGNVLREQGKWEEAIQEHRRAMQLDPNDAFAHHNVGNILRDQGKREEAIQEFRRATQLNPILALPHQNLGFLLAGQGQFEEAIQELRQAGSLGIASANEMARHCERLRDLNRRLPAVLDGKDRPADAQEMLGFAVLCYQPFLKRFAAAARFYTDAFSADAKLADIWGAQHRYTGACCAALAGCGQGNDVARLDDKEKARLRQQALDWLKTDLAHWTGLAQSGKADDRTLVREMLQQWQADTDLAGVRGDALANLPQTERDAWKKLWADVEAVQARTR